LIEATVGRETRTATAAFQIGQRVFTGCAVYWATAAALRLGGKLSVPCTFQ